MRISSLQGLVITGLIFTSYLPLTGQIRFEDVTEKAGLIEPFKGMMGHCAAWGDVNGDGFPDLFFGTFSDYPDSVYGMRGHSSTPEPEKILINRGDGTFEDLLNSPVRIKAVCSGAAFADFDNDGDLDLIVSHQSHDTKNSELHKPNNLFYKNDGKGNFTNVTEKSGPEFWLAFYGAQYFCVRL